MNNNNSYSMKRKIVIKVQNLILIKIIKKNKKIMKNQHIYWMMKSSCNGFKKINNNDKLIKIF